MQWLALLVDNVSPNFILDTITNFPIKLKGKSFAEPFRNCYIFFSIRPPPELLPVLVPTLPGVMKRCCTPCALLCCGEWPYPTSRCQYDEVSINGRIPRRSVDITLDGCIARRLASALEEYHIPIIL